MTPNSGKVALGTKKSALAKLKQDIAAVPLPNMLQTQTSGNVGKVPHQMTPPLHKSPSLLMTVKTEEECVVKTEPDLYTSSLESLGKISTIERKKIVVKKRPNSMPPGSGVVKKKITAANGSIVPTNAILHGMHVKMENEEEELCGVIKIEETTVSSPVTGNSSQVENKKIYLFCNMTPLFYFYRFMAKLNQQL